MFKRLFTAFMVIAVAGFGIAGAGEPLRVAVSEALAPGGFELSIGEKREFEAASRKTGVPGARIGLRIRAFARTQKPAGGWTEAMKITVNGQLLERFTSNRQPRLVNRPDTFQLIQGPEMRYNGSQWYNRQLRVWNLCYGMAYTPEKPFNPNFKEDVTDFVFDIDDLVAPGKPIAVSVMNAAVQSKAGDRKLNMAVPVLELVVLSGGTITERQTVDAASAAPPAPPANVKTIRSVPLETKRFILQAGENRELTGPIIKNSIKVNRTERVGLRIRAFAESETYGGGWAMLMQLAVNDRLVERLNSDHQPRLVNRPDTKQLTGGPNVRYNGSSWYDRFMKSWDVCYGPDYISGKPFNVHFKEDVVDYLFDVDDLIAIDAPVRVKIINVADQSEGLRNLIKLKDARFPLVVLSVELVVFENPADRGAASKTIPGPTAAESDALRKRIREIPELSVEQYAAELAELRRAYRIFPKYERHTLRGEVIPGHLWIDYDSRNRNAESYIPLLDEAKNAGVGLIKVHSYWADINALGPFRPRNDGDAADFRKLIDLCHARGFKLLAYVSPGWVKLNKDYNDAWNFSDPLCKPVGGIQWGRVCTNSPEFRSFFYQGVQQLFNEFPVDGIYVDFGVHPRDERICQTSGHVHAFNSDPSIYASSDDVMNKLYALCRKNGKLMYLFAESIPNVENFCDVQYVGESTPSMAAHRERHGAFHGNIFFLPMNHAFTYYSPREVYASTMALGHFPIFSYARHMKQDEEKKWFFHFLPLWSAMSKPGTHIYRNVTPGAFASAIPADGMLTAYVNTDTYCVLANFGDKPANFTFAVSVEDMESGLKTATITVPERDLRIVRLAPAPDGRIP